MQLHPKLLLLSFALYFSASSAPAAPTHPDKLLDFVDTGVIASDRSPPYIVWLSNTTALVSAKAVRVRKDQRLNVDIAFIDVATGKKATIAEGAELVCWVPEEKFGVAQLSDSPRVNRRIVLDESGAPQLSDQPASRDDCHSRQYAQHLGRLRTSVADLGRGHGVVVNEWPVGGGRSVVATYIREDGTQIPLSYEGAGFAGAFLTPWLKEYYVGKTSRGALMMSEDGTLREDSSESAVRQFFKGPSPRLTKNGYLVYTGVWDPYNGDTFFVPFGETPVRIYKSKGAWDQRGPDGVAPNGCGLLISLSANGPINRVLAYMNRAPQTLHYVDLCATFPIK